MPDEGPRFENKIACQLPKHCHYIEGTEGYRMDLQFILDGGWREVDFVMLQNCKPLVAMECKTSEK